MPKQPQPEQFPAFLGNVTAEQVAAARIKYAQDRNVPGFHNQAGFRLSSLKATMASGGVIQLNLWIEFPEAVPADYKPVQLPPPRKLIATSPRPSNSDEQNRRNGFFKTHPFQGQLASPFDIVANEQLKDKAR